MSVFKLVRPEYEEIVVTVEAPNPDLDPGEINLKFRYLDRAGREAVIADLDRRRREGERREDVDVAGDLLLGWDGVVDGDGAPMKYCPESLVLMYSHPHVARAITEALKDFLFGAPVRRKKSSPTLAGNGRPAMDG